MDSQAVSHSRDSGSREDSASSSPANGSITPWNPPSLTRRNAASSVAASEQDRLEGLRRGVRSSLNKLTPENFERVAVELTNVALKSEIILTSVIDLIFHKALDEPQYNSLYAQLCRRLSDSAPDKDVFKRVLLTQVQNVYVRRSNLIDSKNESSGSTQQADRDEARRTKREHLSNVKFIGELGKLDLLHEQIMHACIRDLVDSKSSPSMADKAEDLECLCQMMRIIGSALDSRAPDKVLMDDYILKLKEYSQSAALPSRIRFLCLDIVELRNNRWIPRRIHQTNAPKTIFQIREEIRAEAGAAKAETMDSALRHSPPTGAVLNTRNPNSPRTVAEKQQDSRNGNITPNRVLGNKTDYNRATTGIPKQSAPVKNPGKSVLKLLQQDAPGSQDIVLRPVTSFNPQRPPKNPETTRNARDGIGSGMPLPVQIRDEPLLARMEKPKLAKNALVMNKNDATHAVTTIVTAFFDHAKDRQHAAASIKEINVQRKVKADLVGVMLKMGMEQGDVNREKISELIVHLTVSGWITENDITEGYDRLLEALDSGTCDPKSCMAVYLADLIASGTISFKNGISLFTRGQHFPLVLMCFQHLDQQKGGAYISEQIVAEKLDLLRLFPDQELSQGVEHIVDVLSAYGLTYLCPSYRLQAQLGRFLAEGSTVTELEQWLAENDTPVFANKADFIYSLIISLVKYIHYQTISLDVKLGGDAGEQARVNEDKFKKLILNYKKLLLRYFDSPTSQLVALYAVQAFYDSIGFPKGWVLRWFCMLHEFDIVEPETFNMWRDEVNDVYPGKGKALFQVNGWLEWLNTVESDSDNEEENNEQNGA